MHAEINVRFEISINEQKELSLATLAEFITDQQIESLLLESIVESLDATEDSGHPPENHRAAQ